jgi:Zn-dependent peptidase ImmA (M78 family)
MKNFVFYIKNLSSSLAQFSKKTGIDENRLKLLSGEKDAPTYAEISIIAKILKLPISLLLKDFQESQNLNVLFRKQFGSATDDIVISNFNYYVQNILDLNPDPSRVVKIREKINPVEDNYNNAEALAFYFRQVYFGENQLDPLTNLPEILSNSLGFIVKVHELGKKADGASALIKNLIFLIISPRFGGRMLFTLAHELAHILNHHENGDFVYFDEETSLRVNNDKLKEEGFANAFASCLLLPEKGLGKLINKVRESFQIKTDTPLSDIEILYISRFYGVSFDVAANRCETLNLIPKGGAFSLSSHIRNDFGSPEKRADQLGIPPRESINFPFAPNFVIERAIDLIEGGAYSIGKISEMLFMPVSEILKHHSQIG